MSGNDLSDRTQDVDDSAAASKCGAPDRQEFNPALLRTVEAESIGSMFGLTLAHRC